METILKAISEIEKFLSKYKLTSVGLVIAFFALKFLNMDVWATGVAGAFIGINFKQIKTMLFDAIDKLLERKEDTGVNE